MSTRIFICLALTVLAALPIFATPIAAEEPALVQIHWTDALEDFPLPIHAHLRGTGGEYVLSRIAPSRVKAAGLEYVVLDRKASGVDYLIGLERRLDARVRAAERFNALLDDGRRVVVRAGSAKAHDLKHLGFQISPLPHDPLVLKEALGVEQTVTRDDEIAKMVAEVRKAFVYKYDGMLSGEEAMRVGGSDFQFDTRSTNSGAPIRTATQFVYEHMLAQGLDVEYHEWTGGGFVGRNVIGELRGTTQPEEIVLIGAHLDSRPFTGPAPGADDNASGSTAVMLAAKILAQREFSRTVRFAFFTGEEQGLLGSRAYATEAGAAGELIVAVLNLDMISWNSDDEPVLRLHTRLTSNPGSVEDAKIADVFIDVVDAYGLSGDLEPILTADGITASDHSPFWNAGYPALLAIEDDVDDFNPNWHRTTDVRSSLDLDYFTAAVKAGVGTIAHLAVPANSAQDVALVRPNQARAAASASTAVDVTWNDRSDNESSFEIVARTPGEPWRTVARAPANTGSYIVGGLTPGVRHEFRVRARWADSASGWSNRAIVTTPDLALLRPVQLRAESSGNEVRLFWTDRSDGETAFEIHLRGVSQPWTRAALVDAEASEAVLTLDSGSYSFRVRARAGGAASGWSNRADVVVVP